MLLTVVCYNEILILVGKNYCVLNVNIGNQSYSFVLALNIEINELWVIFKVNKHQQTKLIIYDDGEYKNIFTKYNSKSKEVSAEQINPFLYVG